MILKSKIYLLNKLSERDLNLLKKDLLDHSVHTALKIKKLDLSKEAIEEVVKNTVERVLLTYKFGNSNSLGNMVKIQALADLRAEFEKVSPDKANKIIWPDLEEKKPFDKLLEVLQKVKPLSKDLIDSIFSEVNDILNGRQQKLLRTVYNNPSITYVEVSKMFGTRGVMTYREIKIIHNQLLQTLEFLGIKI